MVYLKMFYFFGWKLKAGVLACREKPLEQQQPNYIMVLTVH